jgi:hypothetical protein
MIIFGFRSYVRTLLTLTLVCRNGHTAAHRLIERTRKFTLFFVPLFPIARSRATICAACGETLKLDKTQAEALMAQVSNLPATPPPPLGALYPSDPMAPPTSTQLPMDGTSNS